LCGRAARNGVDQLVDRIARFDRIGEHGGYGRIVRGGIGGDTP
jgi:hypothetical protein